VAFGSQARATNSLSLGLLAPNPTARKEAAARAVRPQARTRRPQAIVTGSREATSIWRGGGKEGRRATSAPMRLKRRGWKRTQRLARVSVTGLLSPQPCLHRGYRVQQ
jgi:hypothetical protein